LLRATFDDAALMCESERKPNSQVGIGGFGDEAHLVIEILSKPVNIDKYDNLADEMGDRAYLNLYITSIYFLQLP